MNTKVVTGGLIDKEINFVLNDKGLVFDRRNLSVNQNGDNDRFNNLSIFLDEKSSEVFTGLLTDVNKVFTNKGYALESYDRVYRRAGFIEDKENDRVFVFISVETKATGKDTRVVSASDKFSICWFIVEFSISSGTIKKKIVGYDYVIKKTNVVDLGVNDLSIDLKGKDVYGDYNNGSLYFIVKGDKEPRKATIKDLKSFTEQKNTSYYGKEIGSKVGLYKLGFEDLTLLRKPPHKSIVFSFKNKSNVKVNNITKDSFVFAYRYVYNDNEVSTLSPYSNTAYLDEVANNQENQYNSTTFNCLQLHIKDIPYSVKGVEVFVRRNDSNTFNKIESIDYKQTDNRDLYIDFCNDNIGVPLSEIETDTPFYNVPKFAKELKITQDRLLLGNYKEGEEITEKTNVFIDKGNFSDFSDELDVTQTNPQEITNSLRYPTLSTYNIFSGGKYKNVTFSETLEFDIPINDGNIQKLIFTLPFEVVVRDSFGSGDRSRLIMYEAFHLSDDFGFTSSDNLKSSSTRNKIKTKLKDTLLVTSTFKNYISSSQLATLKTKDIFEVTFDETNNKIVIGFKPDVFRGIMFNHDGVYREAQGHKMYFGTDNNFDVIYTIAPPTITKPKTRICLSSGSHKFGILVKDNLLRDNGFIDVQNSLDLKSEFKSNFFSPMIAVYTEGMNGYIQPIYYKYSKSFLNDYIDLVDANVGNDGKLFLDALLKDLIKKQYNGFTNLKKGDIVTFTNPSNKSSYTTQCLGVETETEGSNKGKMYILIPKSIKSSIVSKIASNKTIISALRESKVEFDSIYERTPYIVPVNTDFAQNFKSSEKTETDSNYSNLVIKSTTEYKNVKNLYYKVKGEDKYLFVIGVIKKGSNYIYFTNIPKTETTYNDKEVNVVNGYTAIVMDGFGDVIKKRNSLDGTTLTDIYLEHSSIYSNSDNTSAYSKNLLYVVKEIYGLIDRPKDIIFSAKNYVDIIRNSFVQFYASRLNYFDELSLKDGEITAIDELGDNIRVFQKEKSTPMLVNKNVLTTARGNSQVSVSDVVLSKISGRESSYTVQNRNHVKSFDNLMLCFDDNKKRLFLVHKTAHVNRPDYIEDISHQLYGYLEDIEVYNITYLTSRNSFCINHKKGTENLMLLYSVDMRGFELMLDSSEDSFCLNLGTKDALLSKDKFSDLEFKREKYTEADGVKTYEKFTLSVIANLKDSAFKNFDKILINGDNLDSLEVTAQVDGGVVHNQYKTGEDDGVYAFSSKNSIFDKSIAVTSYTPSKTDATVELDSNFLLNPDLNKYKDSVVEINAYKADDTEQVIKGKLKEVTNDKKLSIKDIVGTIGTGYTVNSITVKLVLTGADIANCPNDLSGKKLKINIKGDVNNAKIYDISVEHHSKDKN